MLAQTTGGLHDAVIFRYHVPATLQDCIGQCFGIPEELSRNSKALPDTVLKRCRHVITENDRVVQASRCLSKHDVAGFGDLMAESHRSLRDDYEVSCAELDLMVEIAGRAEGAVGSRMTGGGFGGCTINLVRSESVPQFRDQVSTEYHKQTGRLPEIYVSRPAGGAGQVPIPGAPLKA